MNEKPEFTITVAQGGAIYASSSDGAKGTGKFQLDPLPRETVAIFEDWLRENLIRKRQELVVLGSYLYYAIFNGTIPEVFKNTYNSLSGEERLRLNLEFIEDSAGYISLPWEFLYNPERQQFLAVDVNLVLSRYLPLTVPRGSLQPEESPLKILVVVSRPKNEETILSKEVVEAIKEMEKGDRPKVKVEELLQPTVNKLEAKLNEFKPHIFHFIGHGKYNKEQKSGQLALIDEETQETYPCDDFTLIETFRAARAFPRLVFLHMCEGGVAEGDSATLQAFSGFAPNLIHAMIPSVVAMQYPISNADAKAFCLAFYEKIADGFTVDDAVQEGRRKIAQARSSRVFGTPVLYMHSSDGIIMPRKPLPKGMEKNAGEETGNKESAALGKIESAASSADSREQARNAVEVVYKIGAEKLGTIDPALQPNFMLRLVEVRNEILEKPLHEIGITLFRCWQEEQIIPIKQVWFEMMQSAPKG